MATTTKLHPDEIDLLSRGVFETGYKTYVPTGKEIFNTVSPERLHEKETIGAIDGSIDEMAEGEVYSETPIREIGSMTFTSVQYGKKAGVSLLTQEFSNFGMSMKAMNRLGYNARYKQDALLAAVINGAHNETTTYDGEYLLSATHLIADNAAQIQGNLITGALSPEKINEMYVKLSQMKDHGGLIMPLQEAVLLVPRALAMNAWQFLNSPNSPTDSNNNRNFVNSLNIKIVIWDQLDQASAFAYYMLTPKAFHSLTAYQKTAPSLSMYVDDSNDNLFEKVRFVQTQGAADYFGIVGSQG